MTTATNHNAARAALYVAQAATMAAFREVTRHADDSNTLSFAERELLGEKMREIEGLFSDVERLVRR